MIALSLEWLNLRTNGLLAAHVPMYLLKDGKANAMRGMCNLWIFLTTVLITRKRYKLLMATSGNNGASLTERAIQVAAVSFIRNFYSDIVLFAVPNGAATTEVNRFQLIREGLLSGVPDIFVAHQNCQHPGLFIEFKKPGGQLSQKQVTTIERLRKKGYRVEIVYASMEAIDLILEHCGK
jgi:hypothetical protein